MKQTTLKHYRRNPKPFLVLPLIVTDCFDREVKISTTDMAIKKPGLRLFTKTAPKKSKSKKTKEERPLTATLEKPTIIDIRFVGKIDMSLVRKEFLNITNLCRIPLVVKQKQVPRPLSLPPPPKKKCKKKKASDVESSWEDEKSVSSTKSTKSPSKLSGVKTKKVVTKLGKDETLKILWSNFPNNQESINVVAITPLRSTDTNTSAKSLPGIIRRLRENDVTQNKVDLRIRPQCDANNNCTGNPKSLRKRLCAAVPVAKPKTDVKSDDGNGKSSTKLSTLAEPCKSCGRKDQPERLHSHPMTPAKMTKAVEKATVTAMEKTAVVPVKSSVQKPLAMKYVSKSTSKPTRTTNSTNVPQKPVLKSPKKSEPALSSKPPAPMRPASAKKTLTCYLCGREFGTASLPLHEPKCLQKWDLENASLPKHMQRKPPIKPSSSATKEERDKLAWESSQSTLLPCQNCGRTFYPDRLVVHQRSCKMSNNVSGQPKMERQSHEPPPDGSSIPRSPRGPPPTFECYICGRSFGVNSIGIHERQCLKKWTVENDSLPPDIRSPPPVKKETLKTTNLSSNKNVINSESSPSSSSSTPPSSGRRPPLFPCYICGKLFTVNSIYIHEPQCLKMWKIENDKLPPNKRRPQPLKPDIKFTQDGKVDYDATNEANWHSYLAQLIPCRTCNRKFNTDRVEIHERSCKGI